MDIFCVKKTILIESRGFLTTVSRYLWSPQQERYLVTFQ